jgi:hypothetical protein
MSSLGLLATVVVLLLGGQAWGPDGPNDVFGAGPAARAAIDATGAAFDAVATPILDESSDSGAGRPGPHPAVLAQQVRLLTSVGLTAAGLSGTPVAYVLVLTLAAYAAAGLGQRKRLTTARGRQHGRRAPPSRS